MADESLNDIVKKRVLETGTISSADIAASASPAPEVADESHGDINVTVPADDIKDRITESPEHGNIVPADERNAPLLDGSDGFDDDLEIVITDTDRDTFLDAVVKHTRFTQDFTIYGGRITGTLRSRTQAETRAIISQLQREIRSGSIAVDADYTVRLRSMLLAAQVASVDDVDYVELAQPLNPVKDADGNIADPGWLKQAAEWESADEWYVTAIYDVLRKFEAKYWTMVSNAANQDFWRPVTSA